MDFETFDKLSMITHRLECGANFLYVVYDCMNRDLYSDATFAPVLLAAYEYMTDLTKELRILCDGYKSQRHGVEQAQ